MAWTAPRTWVALETVTAAMLNTHVRDNLLAIGDPGAWTDTVPTVAPETGVFTSATASGRYTTMGKTFNYSFIVTITTAGTGAGAVRVNLPVTLRTTGGLNAGSGRSASSGAGLTVTINTGTQLNVLRYDNATAIASGAVLHISGTAELA